MIRHGQNRLRELLLYFRAAGSRANRADNLEEALVLQQICKYEMTRLFYYFADVYNKQENYNMVGICRGLSMETGDAGKAKFYYQLLLHRQERPELKHVLHLRMPCTDRLLKHQRHREPILSASNTRRAFSE